MFAEQILGSTVRQIGPSDAPTGFAVDMRVNWYRTLPVSCIEGLALWIDGRPIDDARLSIALQEQEIPLSEVSKRDDVWWFVLDPCELRVGYPGGLPHGQHTLELALGMRIPYLGPSSDGVFTVIADRVRRTVLAE